MLQLSLFALLFSYLGISGLLWWFQRQQIMLDVPNDRSSHTRPTPRGGGIAIVLTTMVGLLLYTAITSPESIPIVGTFSFGGLVIATVSWLDDRYSLSNRLRFLTHFIAASAVVIGIGYWQEASVPFLGQLNLTKLGMLFTIIWIMGFINAYNFMDGIDGIAGSMAIVAGIGWTLIGWFFGQPIIIVLGILIAASSLGFLAHNWHPAQIFMGDVGSTFLGYTFAVVPLMTMTLADKHPYTNGLLIVSILLLWPFLFDTTFTFSRRLLNGEKVWTAHRSHLYQRLIIAGYPHHMVTLFYIGLAVCGLLLALSLVVGIAGSKLAIALLLPLLCVGLWRYVSVKELHPSP